MSKRDFSPLLIKSARYSLLTVSSINLVFIAAHKFSFFMFFISVVEDLKEVVVVLPRRVPVESEKINRKSIQNEHDIVANIQMLDRMIPRWF